MIDFTNCERNRFRAYGGANGNKINIRYQGKSYMLKFPPKPRRGGEMSYTNGCVSEYLGCHIFASLGFRVQETLLGTYTDNKNKEKLVVACGDFTEGGKQLIEFAKLKNTCIDSELNGYGTELSTILDAIEEQTLLPPKVLREFFWDQFIADAFLGNFDRHNGNWGVLVDENLGTAELAPVYDCGSCLYPQLSEEGMRAVLDDPEEIRQRIYMFPSSAIKEDGVKIPYAAYISSLKNPECNAALRRIAPRIDMGAIQKIIEDTPSLSSLQREFYLTMLQERKEQILDSSLEKLLAMEEPGEEPQVSQRLF